MKRTEKSFGSFGNLPVQTFLFEDTKYDGEWQALDERVRLLEKQRKVYRELTEDMAKKENSMAADIRGLDNTIAKFKREVAQDEQLNDDPVRRKKIAEAIDGIVERKASLETILPQKNSLLLQLSLGDINVTLPRQSDRLLYKKSYEMFKMKMVFVAFIFTFSRILLVDWGKQKFRILDILFHVFLAWYYSTITLREHILIANGSRIRTWWQWHHYLSLGAVATLLVWPDSATYHEFYPHFNLFCCYMGFLQLVEYRYQITRMYKLRALGKVDAMAVPTEFVEVQWQSGFPLLFPLLLIGQFWILYVAFYLFQLARSSDAGEWQPPVLGALFFVIGIGNLAVTLSTGKKVLSVKFSK